MTAHYLINSSFHVEPGHTVLVHAGAGGVGLLMTQLLKARGARVITTVSTDEKEELARAAGADEVLRYEGFADAVRELTNGVGVDVVYDGVGKDTFDGSLASLRTRGFLVLFGAASGPVPPVDPQRLNAGGSLSLTRPKLADFLAQPAGTAVAFQRNFRCRGGRKPQGPDRRELSAGRSTRGPTRTSKAAAPRARSSWFLTAATVRKVNGT